MTIEWQFSNCPLIFPLTPILLYYRQMTETVNVLPHIREMKETWRRQDFKFTPAQQEEYDLLIAARRERVKYFYDNDMVCKISKSVQDKLRDAEDN